MFWATSVYPKLAVHFLHQEYVFLAVLIINVICKLVCYGRVTKFPPVIGPQFYLSLKAPASCVPPKHSKQGFLFEKMLLFLL